MNKTDIMIDYLTKPKLLDLYAFILGGLLVLAFAPYNLSFLAMLIPAGLLAVWLPASPRRCAWRGFLFGLGLFGFGATWVYISIHQFGGVGVALASLLTLLPLCLLAAFPALQGYLFSKLWPRNTLYKLLLIFPALWVLFEWIREWFLTGFPWLYLGTSQVNGLLAGFAPVAGTFGTSFVVALVSCLLYVLINKRGLARYFSFVIFIILLMLSQLFFHINWSKPTSKPLSVALVQGNVAQSLKWDPNAIVSNIRRYIRLTQPYWHKQLIIWPENAIPLPSTDAFSLLSKLNAQAKHFHSTLLTGIPIAKQDRFYNGMLALGATHGQYLKRHLVPFGEYVPFGRELGKVIAFFDLPMSDFTPGPMKQPLIHLNKQLTIAPFICYEIAYSNLIDQDLPRANLLVVISDDAWFGHSIAAWQHLQIAQMQALSTGREILFGSNNGITALINAHGQVTATIPRFKQAVLSGRIQPLTGTTPWVWLGNIPIILLMIFLLLLGLLFRKRGKHK